MRERYLAVAAVILIGIAVPAAGAEGAATASSDWEITLPALGEAAGETRLSVVFPEPVTRAPLTFGIPLGQVASPERIVLLDEEGRPLPADFAPLGNWDRQPARWTLVSCVVDAKGAGAREFTLRWGEDAPPPKAALEMGVDGRTVEIVNGDYSMTVSPSGVNAVSVSGKAVQVSHWKPFFTVKGKINLSPKEGELRILHDGNVRKAVRFATGLSEALDLHQEFTFYAGSPYVRCDVRFINRSTSDIQVGPGGITVFEAELENVTRACAGLEHGTQIDPPDLWVRQEAFGWEAGGNWTDEPHDRRYSGADDVLGEWVCLRMDNGVSLMLVFPHFQEMAAGERGLGSSYAVRFAGEARRLLSLCHYFSTLSSAPAPDVCLREGMARTFTYWLVFDPPRDHEAAIARAVKAMPHVVYDRQYLTDMGVFQERAVSHLFDEELLEAALYYKRAQVPRPEYIRCSRGADPGPDKSGEGFYEVDLHAGGMVFGEVFQYFDPKPTAATVQRYHEEIGIARDHIITGGSCTYRNGDIVLALYQQYLRTGHRELHDFARVHAQVFADVSVSHARASAGLGHYYCDWYVNPYVYQRFEGLLLAALVTGDPWLFETAQAMADYCVRAWKDGEPRDGELHGGLGGVQYRSSYIAKMLLRMYEVTGKKEYADTAVRLAQWIMPLQEPEGWWRATPGATREYRNSPIFAGYTSTGLWPLYHATRNEPLLRSLMKTVDYHVSMQEDVSGNNPGTLPNSYWYRRDEGSQSKRPIPEETQISANYPTTSHWANVMLQAYLATGREDYFYSANAAWAGVLNHQTAEGGVPLSSGGTNSVWSHVMVESLAAFAAVAEERKLPIVLGGRAGAPVPMFMGKGAAYKDGVFTFAVKYKHDKPAPLRVFFPKGEPVEVALDGDPVAYTYDPARRVVRFEVPPSPEFRTASIALRGP